MNRGGIELLDKEVILKVPLHPDELDTVRLTLYGVAVRMGFTYESIEDLKVAVTEACNHVLLKQVDQEIEACLQLVFTIRPQELVVRIETEGVHVRFAEEKDGERSAASDSDGLNILGSLPLGLYLMQALVDEVSLVPGKGEVSDQIVLVKRLE